MSLVIVPCHIAAAKAFVTQHHRHHTAPVGALFAVAVAEGDDVVGVAMVGRPTGRHSDDGWTAEVTRLCVLVGHMGACSKLYAASWRAARALGWRKLITYTLPEEGGASLRGAGWKCLGEAGGGSWSSKSRPRVDKHPLQVKMKWEVCA
jgi:L-amino acid N-acyltransferase YncA